jgi:hypothetical protein
LGEAFCTMGALAAFAGAIDEDLNSFLARHANGDWGEVNEHDRRANEYALHHSLRVLSSYTLSSGERDLDNHGGRPEQHNDSAAFRILMDGVAS